MNTSLQNNKSLEYSFESMASEVSAAEEEEVFPVVEVKVQAPQPSGPGVGCLICSASPGDKKTSANIFDDSDFPSVWEKICDYWLIPSRESKKVLALCKSEQFCRSCARSVKEILRIQGQIEALEYKMKVKVEELGRTLATAANVSGEPKQDGDRTRKSFKREQEMWRKLRNPVAESKKVLKLRPAYQ
jgi:hypothetical protein